MWIWGKQTKFCMTDALQEKWKEAAQSLIDILNESLYSYCGIGKQAGKFAQTFILGAFFSAVCNPSTGVTIIPRNSIPAATPPFQLQWQQQMNEQSISFLLRKLLEITDIFITQLQLHPQPKPPQWENPVWLLAEKAVTYLTGIRRTTGIRCTSGMHVFNC